MFFLLNKVGESWVGLPQVTPAQIVVSRQIKKFLTGNLEVPVSKPAKTLTCLIKLIAYQPLANIDNKLDQRLMNNQL